MKLIEAQKDHCNLLYRWANDQDTRMNAFNQELISQDTHIIWFEKKLQDPNSLIFILVDDEKEIGQIRVDIENVTALIDFSIDRVHRGKGYGTRLIQLVETKIQQKELALNEIVGFVKKKNLASQKAFLRNGYKENRFDDIYKYSKNLMVSRDQL